MGVELDIKMTANLALMNPLLLMPFKRLLILFGTAVAPGEMRAC